MTCTPSRRAMSMMGVVASSTHWRSPQGMGSMRLSVRAATRHKESTASRGNLPSNVADTTSKSISLHGPGWPEACEPKMTPMRATMPCSARFRRDCRTMFTIAGSAMRLSTSTMIVYCILLRQARTIHSVSQACPDLGAPVSKPDTRNGNHRTRHRISRVWCFPDSLHDAPPFGTVFARTPTRKRCK